MAEDKLYKYWKDIPPIGKAIIGVGVLAAVGLVGFKIYKDFKLDADKKDSEKLLDSNRKQLHEQLNAGHNPSFPLSSYISLVNDIVHKLDGCETFESEMEVIVGIAKIVKKPIDWYYLVDKFGVKTIDNCGVMTGDTVYALPDLMKDQLDSSGYFIVDDKSGKIKSGWVSNSYNVLENYLTSIGVTI